MRSALGTDGRKVAFAIRINAVGRLREGPERALFEVYARRLQWPIRVEEITLKPNLPAVRQKTEATQKLLALVPEAAAVIALDEGGSTLSSADFATRIGRWRDDGRAGLCFLIGGAEGLGEAALERAELALSLGRDDLAASSSSRPARRTALPGATKPQRTPLPPGRRWAERVRIRLLPGYRRPKIFPYITSHDRSEGMASRRALHPGWMGVPRGA